MVTNFKKFDFTLKNSSSMMVAGPTQSGKSTFVHTLLNNLDIFEQPPSKIYYFYGALNDAILKLPSHVIIHEGLPDNFNDIEPNSLIVLDDLMHESKNDSNLTNAFTRSVHHKKLFVINITQNFYEQSGDARTRRLNVQYIVLFKNPADVTQVNTLGRQMYPTCPKFLPAVYNEVTRRPHGYLFIDLKQETPDEYRIRSNILPNQFPMLTFHQKNCLSRV